MLKVNPCSSFRAGQISFPGHFNNLAHLGVGIRCDLSMEAIEIEQAIRRVLETPSYTEAARKYATEISAYCKEKTVANRVIEAVDAAVAANGKR